MGIDELLTPARVIHNGHALSRKKALELISEQFSENLGDIEALDLYERYLARERLGSTALGHGVALPHIRCAHTQKPIALLLSNPHGIDFDAPDDEKVDLILALLVPDDNPDEHLQTLASIARLLSRRDYRQALRACADSQSLYQVATRDEYTNNT